MVEMRDQLVEQSEHTHLLIKFAVLYGHSWWHTKTITIVTSSQINITNIIIMKKFEILRELPKCDTKTGSEQMLLGKWC